MSTACAFGLAVWGKYRIQPLIGGGVLIDRQPGLDGSHFTLNCDSFARKTPLFRHDQQLQGMMQGMA
jgi:hypothetical protein